MKPRVLILAGKFDFSADLVALALESKGVCFLRLNREQLPSYRVSLDPLVPSLMISADDFECEVAGDLEAVWFRQPIFSRNVPNKSINVDEQLRRSQWPAFVRSMRVFNNARWMNAPENTYLAEIKPFQLQRAHACGFLIAPTLITNDALAIRRRFPDAVAIKPLDTALMRKANEALFAYTNITSSSELDVQSFVDVPVIAQEALVNKIDHRVTIIGEEVRSVRILNDGRGIYGDWRLEKAKTLEYVDTELPSNVARACRSLAAELQLPFAAIDLIEANGDFFFVEVNPTGEFAWLESPSRPMATCIANWLAGTT